MPTTQPFVGYKRTHQNYMRSIISFSHSSYNRKSRGNIRGEGAISIRNLCFIRDSRTRCGDYYCVRACLRYAKPAPHNMINDDATKITNETGFAQVDGLCSISRSRATDSPPLAVARASNADCEISARRLSTVPSAIAKWLLIIRAIRVVLARSPATGCVDAWNNRTNRARRRRRG